MVEANRRVWGGTLGSTPPPSVSPPLWLLLLHCGMVGKIFNSNIGAAEFCVMPSAPAVTYGVLSRRHSSCTHRPLSCPRVSSGSVWGGGARPYTLSAVTCRATSWHREMKINRRTARMSWRFPHPPSPTDAAVFYPVTGASTYVHIRCTMFARACVYVYMCVDMCV